MKKKNICGWVLLCILLLAPFFSEAATVKFRITAANPSRVKNQIVPVKVFLPEEIKPANVLDAGGLNLEFDSHSSSFYVYREGMLLKPGELRVFEVEVQDVWLIPQQQIDDLKQRADILLGSLANSEYHARMKNLAQTIDSALAEVVKTQNDETISKSQHIGAYRINVKTVAKLKEEISAMEKIIENMQTGPLTPDVFSKSKFKSKVPTRTATWLIIFSVIIFIALLSAVFFFTWYQQSKVTQKVISEARDNAFNATEKKPEQGADNKPTQ
jgi:hypothetical protein